MTTTVPPLALTILRQGERLFVDLAEVGTLIPRGETRVEDAFLREVAMELRLLATPGFSMREGRESREAGPVPPPAPGMQRTLERLGGLLFSHLFPESARVRLRAAAPGDLYLRLDEQLLALPWELAYDGQDFLATKFCVGRQVITSQPLPETTQVPASAGPLKVLLIADPTETLPQAAAEVERLCAVLEDVPGVEVTLLGGKNVRKLSLLAAVQEHAVVHFAGHSVYDPRAPGESGWRLHEGLLTARELGKLTQPPRLIFSNSCQAGATTGWVSSTQDGDPNFGLGSTFLLAGVPNYIGPCWVVDDVESVEFALAFYRHVAAGASLGTALRAARLAGTAEHQTATLTWASYVLYGNPTATLLAEAARLEERTPSSSEKNVRQGTQLPRAPRRKRTATTSPRRASQPARTAPKDSAPTPSAERRQLTVLFCDLVDFTVLSTRLDPEELHEVVRTYHETCAAVIQRYDGHMAQYLGDGLLVYFGYPVAYEDAAQRAVRAGLGIVEAMQSLSTKLTHPLRVRIGIHTGLVVVGDVGSGKKREQLAVGEAPNIAARLQGIAAPDTVVMSEATERLVAGQFVCQSLGPQSLKGLPTAVEVYQVLKESEDQGRFAVAVKRGLTPLVGREAELGLLRERWAQARDGQGQVVLLSGEPGIGKSRLAQEMKEQVTKEDATQIEFRCSPYFQNSALYPIIDHLQRLLQFARDDTPATKLGKLQHTLSHYRFPQADTVPLLAALWSLPHPEGAPPLNLSPQKQKQKTLEALVAWIMEEAERQVVYCTWEDLHWADPTTLEILQLYLEQIPTARMLTVLTFRPEFQPPWSNRTYMGQLTLSRLGRKHVEAMTENITGRKSLPTEVVQQIVTKTDGVPLFVEELTKTVLESGLIREANGRYELTGPLPPLAIPATLHDSLMARLDRLAPVKEIAQLGATLGREFSYEVLKAVSPLDEELLQQGLTRLVEAELVHQRGIPPQARYLFKHALVQETAYQSLLKSKRQQYHQQIADVLQERFPETVETQPELLAHHYTQAGLIEQAIPYWQQAGQRASQRSADVEAIAHLTKGLELLKTLPDTPERIQQELALQIALATPFVAIKGYAAPEVEQAYTRALALCRQVGETPLFFTVMGGLCTFYLVRGEVQTARELTEQLLRLAQQVQDPALLLVTRGAMGVTSYFLGEFVPAREHCEQAIALYNPQPHRSHAALFQDPGVICLVHAAWTAWYSGYPDHALQRNNEALAVAQEMSHPYNLAFALACASWLHQFRGEVRLTQERAEATILLCTEYGFPFYLACGTILRGWALATQGQTEEGIAQIHQGWPAWQAMGAELWSPYWLGLLAEAYGKGGQPEEGLINLTEGLATVNKTELRFYETELYRLKGMLTLQEANQKAKGKRQKSKVETNLQHLPPNSQGEAEQEAEGYFLKAIDISRKQQAKSLELRAVMSLSRLWQQQGKKTEAHQMLAEIYNWFTEGFDTKDLQEAKALLTALA